MKPKPFRSGTSHSAAANSEGVSTYMPHRSFPAKPSSGQGSWGRRASELLRLPVLALLLLSPVCLVSLVASGALAATLIVMPDGSGPFPTIEAAISAAANGDTVALGDGIFRGAGNRDNDFGGHKGLTIRSQSGNPRTCIVDCQGNQADPHRGFQILDGDAAARLEGVTITNGYGPGHWDEREEETGEESTGGAILCDSETDLRIYNCVFHNNSADVGGAIAAYEISRPRIVACIFSNNTATFGGGVYSQGASPELRSCTFFGNAATQGAGLYRGSFGSIDVEHTIVAFSTQGGAAYCTEGAFCIWATCSDVYGNVGGDWTGGIGGQDNLSADPLFCDAAAGDFTLAEASPCAPAHSPAGCGLIGAEPVGCVTPINQPPDCSTATVSPAELWPPRHNFRNVDIVGVTDPDGDPITIVITDVTQDEPLDGNGDGRFCPDARMLGDQLQLRAERLGPAYNVILPVSDESQEQSLTGNGRVYVIHFTATDGRGGSCSGTASVCVPHDRRPGHSCIDNGQMVSSFGPCQPSRPLPDRDGAGQGKEFTSVELGRPEVTRERAVINYALPADGSVGLTVFDVAGRHVATLANSFQTRGQHSVTWDVSGLARGVYYARIQAHEVTLTRPIVVR